MAEKPLLQDLCKSSKGGNSYKKIAEISGVPENTVNNFFSEASKDPSIYTAGPICRACNVSLDEYFDIVPSRDAEQEHRIELLGTTKPRFCVRSPSTKARWRQRTG